LNKEETKATKGNLGLGFLGPLLNECRGVRRGPALALKEAKILLEKHKAVLLVVIGYRQKGGVSKSRVGEILGLEASFYLGDLLSQGLIYCTRELPKDQRSRHGALLD
jgi:hypothetical protein